MKVFVKQDHILRSRKLLTSGANGCYPSEHCPIALALKDQTHKRVFVGARTMEVNGRKYLMPLKAAEFIRKFDSQKSVKPFVFETYPLSGKRK